MRYTWPQDTNGIQEIRISFGEKAIPEAVVFAPSGELGKAAGLDKILAENGFSVSYDIVERRPALRVSGFKQPSELLALLERNEMISGIPVVQQSAKEKKPFDRLTGAAFFYEMGNITGLVGGILRKDKDERDSNLAFLAGDSVLLMFGRRTFAEKQISVMQGFGKALHHNGIEIEGGSPFAAEHTRNLPGVWNTIRRWMSDKVIVAKSIAEITAGYKRILSGRNQGNLYKQISGVAVITGYSTSLLVNEKKPSQLRARFNVKTNEEADQAIKKLPLMQRIWLSVERWPLFPAAAFAAINNVSEALGALDERKHHRRITQLETELGYINKPNSTELEDTYAYTAFGMKFRAKIDEEHALPAMEKAQEAYNESKLKQQTPEIARETQEKRTQLVAAESRVNDLKASLRRAEDAKNQNLWIFDLGQAAFFGIANLLYATSSKTGNTENQEKLADRFFAAAASEILKVPAEQQQYLLGVASQYAGRSRDFDMTPQEAHILLEKKMQVLEANPWLRAKKGLAPLMGSTALMVPKELLQHPVAEVSDIPVAARKEAPAHSFVNSLGAHPYESRRNILANPLESFTTRYDAEQEIGGVIGMI